MWWCVFVAFLVISLWPIWCERFPPLQDYPEHLLHAHMLAHRHDPTFNYGRDFEFHLTPVYATFFAVTISFSKFLPIEVAGKAALSLYIVLIAALVVKLARRLGSDIAWWGLLLFFPLAFNQQYFQGNINYCYSLPLLLFTLLDADDLSTHSLGVWQLARHVALQVVLFFTHPLTFLVYLGLAFAAVVLSCRERDKFKRALIAPLAGLGLLAVWLIVGKYASASSEVFGRNGVFFYWKPISDTAAFCACMFTGMRWNDGVDSLSATLWIVVAFLAFRAWLAEPTPRQIRSQPYLLFFSLTIASVFLLPFSVNDSSHPDVRLISFFGWRMAAVSCCFLAILIGQVKLRGVWATAFVLCVSWILLLSVQKQQQISREIRSIEEVICKIPPNSRILPLVFSRTTPELDPVYFDMHLHVHNYYHLLGGGLSPYFFPAPQHLVHLRAGINLPAPGEYSPGQFRWEQHADNYQYFLVRGAPLSFILYMNENTEPIARSGEWLLLKRKRADASAIAPATQ